MFQAISLFVFNSKLWTLLGPFSKDFTAGFVSGYSHVINNTDCYLQIVDTNHNIINNPDFNDYKIGISDIYNFNLYNPTDDHYGWWIKDVTSDKYLLYQFKTNDFIQGFISSLNQIGKDFRDYIGGNPFKIINGIKIEYSVEGYDIEPIIPDRIRAPVGAFYTGTYENDPYGEDFD